MENNKIDILFLDGLTPRTKRYPIFIGFIFSIGAILKKNGYKFKIFNVSILEDYSIEIIINHIKKINPKIIGISTHSDNIRWVYLLVNAIKKDLPKVPIILGGPQVSFAPVKTLERCQCDVAVRHEGEFSLLELLEYYINKKGNLEEIKGITYRANNKIISNKDRELLNLDDLPRPLYEVFNDDSYWYIPDTVREKTKDFFFEYVRKSNNAFLTSRGCPYRCVFCVEGSLKNKHRMRSTDNVLLDLEHYIKNIQLNNIVIADDTFTSNKKRVVEICKRIKILQLKYDFKWFAEARVNVLDRNPEIIDIMVDAGLYSLQIGIESGSQSVLDAQNKKITLDQIRNVAKYISKFKNKGITLSGNFILGGPGETLETLKETISFSKELLKLADYQIELKYSFLVPFEGTPIRINPELHNLIILDEDFEQSKLQFSDVICHSKYLTKSDLVHTFREIGNELKGEMYRGMFSLPKHDIDNRIRFDKTFTKKYQPTFLSSLIRTYYSLYLLHDYYELHEHDATKKDIMDKNILQLYPIAIWDLEYDSKKDLYKFINFQGKEILLEKELKYLWEQANGHYTISEIINNSNSPFNDETNAEKVAVAFYSFMYEQFSILLREY